MNSDRRAGMEEGSRGMSSGTRSSGRDKNTKSLHYAHHEFQSSELNIVSRL